ncbi:hypothetical protein Tco_1224048, partial [Tanacetum coccineum]
MSFSKRSNNASLCYTKPLDSLKNWNDHFFWVDAFACPALFSWHTAKNLIRELLPDPTKVKVVMREREENEHLLLETTVGRTVPLLPVASDHVESELEASVDRIFGEGDSGDQTKQGGSPKRHKKRKTMAVDAGKASHPAKKNRGRSWNPSGRLLYPTVFAAIAHTYLCDCFRFYRAETCGMEITLNLWLGLTSAPLELVIRFVFTSDSTSPFWSTIKTEAGKFILLPDLSSSDFLVDGIRTVIDPDTDLQKVYVPQWSVTNGSGLDDGHVCCEMVDEFAPPKFFASVRGMEHDQLYTEFNNGAACQMCLSAEVRMRAEYNIKEMRRLKSVVEKQDELLKTKEGEIDNQKAEAAEAIRLRAEASNFETVEKTLWDEVNALKERNTILKKERTALDVKVTDLKDLVVGKERELTGLNAQLTSVKSQNDNLVEWENVTVYEDYMGQLEKFQDDRMKEVNDKFDKLYVDFIEMALHLVERLYPHLLTTISHRRWLLTHGMELAITKCLHSLEYLSALGAAIDKAIEMGMQDGLSARITHGTEGRALTDVAAYNPSTKSDYISALQHLQSVNFSLLAELRSNKDASIDTLMNIIRLEDTLAERLGLTESQPHVDQLMVPIHHSLDQVVVGASALSLALDVSSSCVRKIKKNIANY